jgi:anti-sigma B factor antagonist
MIGTTAFSVDVQIVDTDTTVIAVVGDLDLSAAPLLRRALLCALAESRMPCIVLDLSGMAFTDSTGLGLIIAGHKRAKARGGLLALAAVPQNTNSLLRIAGLSRLLALHATVAEAQAALLAARAASARSADLHSVSL